MFSDIITQYGLLGLFISSLMGSTIFVPLTTEILFPPLIASDLNLYAIVIVASLGSLIGTWINYGLGFLGSEIIEKRIDYDSIEHAKRIMNKYGWFGLFVLILLPIPLPVDPITIVPGIARMNFLEFSVVIIVGKLIKYSFIVGLFNGLLSFF